MQTGVEDFDPTVELAILILQSPPSIYLTYQDRASARRLSLISFRDDPSWRDVEPKVNMSEICQTPYVASAFALMLLRCCGMKEG